MKTGALCRQVRGRAHVSAAVLGLFGALVLTPASLQAQVAVDELELHFHLAPGRGPLTQVVPVRNEQDKIQQVRVVLNDWQRDTLGRNEFHPVGSTPGSCNDKVKVFPMTFQVAPGAVEYVRVTFDGAGDLAGCWSIVLFETVKPPPPRNEQQGSFLSIDIRTGVKLYIHPARPVRAGEIAFADVVEAWIPQQVATGSPRDSVKVWQADVRFKSAGNDHLKLKTTIEIRDADGLLLQKVAAPDAYITPNAVRDQRITLPPLAKGEYVALVMVDFGGDEITAAQVEFKIP